MGYSPWSCKEPDRTERLSMRVYEHASASLTLLRELSPESGAGRVWERGCSDTGICGSQFVPTSETWDPRAANPTRTENCLCGWSLPPCAHRWVWEGSPGGSPGSGWGGKTVDWPESLGFGIDLGRELPDWMWPCPRVGSTGRDWSLASQSILLRLWSARGPEHPRWTPHALLPWWPLETFLPGAQGTRQGLGTWPETGPEGGGAAGHHSTPRPPRADRSRACLSCLPGGTRATSLRPCPRSPAPVQ